MDDLEPFERIGGGHFRIGLTQEERRLLRELPADLIKQLESGGDDGTIYRLFPPGYTDDLGRQVEYDRLMRDDLQSSHVEALRLLQDSSDAYELSTDQLEAWTRAVNHLRLVLGTRLDITDDFDERELEPDDPRMSTIALYLYLNRLQQCAIEALGQPDVSL